MQMQVQRQVQMQVQMQHLPWSVVYALLSLSTQDLMDLVEGGGGRTGGVRGKEEGSGAVPGR